MRRLMTKLAQIGCPKAKLEEEIYAGLRVVAGGTGDERSLLHHYDKHVITALAPILIPEGPKRRAGELVVFPNRRGYRRFALFNIIEKAIVQSNWYRNRINRKLAAGDLTNVKYLSPATSICSGATGPIIPISRSPVTRSGRRCCSIMAIRIRPA